MFTTNPFAELSATIPSGLMQTYVILMILLVVGGTIYDVMHKRSAKYFAELSERSRTGGSRTVSSSESTSLMIQTAMVDVATSAEFCNPHRRIAHLLTMYGFILYLIATICLVFSGADASGFMIFLWYVSALMVAGGGYWFWFFIRVDVSAEGLSPFRLVRADLFVVSLLALVTFGILWGMFQGAGILSALLLIAYVAASLALFGAVPWSKFAHMFFKPAAAYQKRMAYASGQAMNLPTISRDDPEQRERHSMELLRDAPMNMGLGIKREDPHHY